MTPIEQAADALRRHENQSAPLQKWNDLTQQEQRLWLSKVTIVISTYTGAVASLTKRLIKE